MTDLARLRDRALELALTQEGTREDPPKSNDGRLVRAYLAAVGLGPGHPWCLAFVQFCYQEAGRQLGGPIYLPPEWVTTGRVHPFWFHAAPAWGSGSPTAGAIACHDAGHGLGHAGLVIHPGTAGAVVTIEGNTDDAGSRTGGAVMRHTRSAAYWNLGFIDVGQERPERAPRASRR